MSPMRIMVVEDDAAVRESLRRALQLEGYEVELAEDGAEALEKLEESPAPPDALVLDVSMPRLDGLEVSRRLRREGNALPVLMLTARDEVSDRVAGLDAGADDYVVKPFALEELLARLRALLRRAAASATPCASRELSDPPRARLGRCRGRRCRGRLHGHLRAAAERAPQPG